MNLNTIRPVKSGKEYNKAREKCYNCEKNAYGLSSISPTSLDAVLISKNISPSLIGLRAETVNTALDPEATLIKYPSSPSTKILRRSDLPTSIIALSPKLDMAAVIAATRVLSTPSGSFSG